LHCASLPTTPVHAHRPPPSASPTSRSEQRRTAFGAAWAVPPSENLFGDPNATIPAIDGPYLGTGSPPPPPPQLFSVCAAGVRQFSSLSVADPLRPGSVVVDVTDSLARCGFAPEVLPSPSQSPSAGTRSRSPTASPSSSRGLVKATEDRWVGVKPATKLRPVRLLLPSAPPLLTHSECQAAMGSYAYVHVCPNCTPCHATCSCVAWRVCACCSV
jgi:hypothetical protein